MKLFLRNTLKDIKVRDFYWQLVKEQVKALKGTSIRLKEQYKDMGGLEFPFKASLFYS